MIGRENDHMTKLGSKGSIDTLDPLWLELIELDPLTVDAVRPQTPLGDSEMIGRKKVAYSCDPGVRGLADDCVVLLFARRKVVSPVIIDHPKPLHIYVRKVGARVSEMIGPRKEPRCLYDRWLELYRIDALDGKRERSPEG